MARRKVSAAEVRLAKQFLKAVGANPNNGQLILAVAAWVHVNFKSLANVRGHNPFLVRAGIAGASKYGQGTFQYKGVWYVKYRSIAEAIKGAAYIFKVSKGNQFLPGIYATLQALKHGRAVDFLAGLASSDWSSTHYGLSDADVEKNAGTTVNPLLRAYSNSTYVLPTRTVTPPKPPPAPKPVRFMVNDVPRREYIQPYHALHWYEARVKRLETTYDTP
jgi:hypothetical protein